MKYTFREAWTWGLLGWAKPLLQIAYNDPAIDEMAERAIDFRSGHYHRLQIDVPIDLDDSSPQGVKRLVDATEELLKREKDRLDRIIYQLSLPRPDRCGSRLGANYVRPDGPRESVRKKADEVERRRLALLLQEEERKHPPAPEPTDTAEITRQGRVFRDCPTCPEMVVVPAGEFTLGSPENEEGRTEWEGPQLKVTIAQPFAVGRFEITFDEWDVCFAAGSCEHRPNDYGRGRGRLPATDVSWDDAQAYVGWLSRKTGKTYRLLTEAEWEYAARAGTTTPFSWGSSISTSQANYDGRQTYGGSPTGEYRAKMVPVDSFRSNPWGLHQMHGNAGEWVQDCAYYTYDVAPKDGSAWEEGDCKERMVRGGALHDGPSSLRSAARHRVEHNDRGGAGFRVARTLP